MSPAALDGILRVLAAGVEELGTYTRHWYRRPPHPPSLLLILRETCGGLLLVGDFRHASSKGARLIVARGVGGEARTASTFPRREAPRRANPFCAAVSRRSIFSTVEYLSANPHVA